MFKVFLTAVVKLVVGSLSRVLIATVTNLDNTDLSGPEKRDAAFNLIKEEAVKEGKSLRDNLINLAIELSVEIIRQKK